MTIFRTLLFFVPIASFALCLLSPASSMALESSVFTVRDVQIDVTAESSAAARQKAFEQAQKKAFQRLTRRVLRFEDASILSLPDSNTLRRLIQDYEIRNEKLSSVRYIANYIFRFKEEAVRDYFDKQGLSYTDIGSKPVLVLPFYQSSERMVLWDDDNPWLAAWSRTEGNQGLVPVTIPIGDLQDVQYIKDDEALAYSKDNLNKLINRYNAGEAIILIAAQPRLSMENVSPDDPAQSPVTIFIYRTDTAQPEFVTKISLTPEKEETRRQLFDRGATRVFSLLQRNWKQQTIVNPDEKNTLRVNVRYNTLEEWVAIKSSLKEVQGLLNTEYLSISPAQAEIKLFFKGSEQRLRLSLAQEDMQLSKPRVDIASLLQEDANTAAPLFYELSLN